MVMRVFVAGGAGVLGQRLVPQLVARGHQVTATTTSAAPRCMASEDRLASVV
jgi:nucleoside-diphosphate-sugar epimerase